MIIILNSNSLISLACCGDTNSSEEWREEVLTDVAELDWSDLDVDAGHALLRWIYTDIVDLQQQDSLSMSLLKAAHKFKLNSLMGKN